MRPSFIAFLFIAFSIVCALPVPTGESPRPKVVRAYFHRALHTLLTVNFLSQQFAHQILSQGTLTPQVKAKQINDPDEREKYLEIFKRGKKEHTVYGFKVAVPTESGKMPLNIERIPGPGVVSSSDPEIKPMTGYEFDRWLNGLDGEERLKGWWIGHDKRARYIVSEIPHHL